MTDSIFCIKVSWDSKFFVTCSADDTFKKWNIESGELEHERKAHIGGVSSGVISSSGKYLITGGNDKKMIVWNDQGNVIWEKSHVFSDGNLLD